jgi:hypothetical protein
MTRPKDNKASIPETYSRCLPWHTWALELLEHLQNTSLYDTGSRGPSIRYVPEVSEWKSRSLIYHEFDLSDFAAVYRHYNILKGMTTSFRRPLIVINEMSTLHILLLGQLLDLDPAIWICHMWRDLMRAPSEFGLSSYEHLGASHDGACVYFDARPSMKAVKLQPKKFSAKACSIPAWRR